MTARGRRVNLARMIVRVLVACAVLVAFARAPALASAPAKTGARAKTAAPARASAPAIRPATAADLVALAKRPGAQATLIDVWATWCVPCREEFPDLLRLERAYRARGLRLVLVSTDFDAPTARRFLARQGVSFASYLKQGDDQSFINGLDPRWSGAQPAVFVYDRAGRLVRFWEGKADYARFEQAVHEAMGHGQDLGIKESKP